MFTRGRRGPELRPFSASAEVVCRGYSPALQRALTDFGADEPFAGAAAKRREHYGIDVPVGAVRVITEHHGAAMLAGQPPRSPWPETAGVPRLIAELDGSMVPRVETAALIPLGYPLGTFGRPARRPVVEITHLDRWGEHPRWGT